MANYPSSSATTSTVTRVSSANTDTVILAQNNNRKLVVIYNESTAVLYLLFNGGTSSTTNYSIQIPANTSYVFDFGDYVGPIKGIWAAVNGAAQVTEFI